MPGTNKAARLQPEKHRRQRGGSSAPQLCPAAAHPPSLRTRRCTRSAAPTYSSGSRASAEVPGRRSAAHGRGAGLCRFGGAAETRRASGGAGSRAAPGGAGAAGGRRVAEGRAGGREEGRKEWKKGLLLLLARRPQLCPGSGVEKGYMGWGAGEPLCKARE